MSDFEQEATRQDESRLDDRPEDNNVWLNEAANADAWMLFFLAAGYGGVSSWEQAKRRDNGRLVIPFARLDLSYQDVESDVTAGHISLEAGYGPIAAWYQHSRFKESTPNSTLKLRYAQALYRMTFGPAVEIDLGAGGSYLNGNQSTSGFGFSLPVKIHPWDTFGFEFRPVWSNMSNNSISDYTLTALGGWNHIKLKAGYRWLKTDGASLNGPFAGIIFSY